MESALPVGVDPREHARALLRTHDAVLSGAPSARASRLAGGARPLLRQVIEDSWQRVLRGGVDPDVDAHTEPLDPGELNRHRLASGLEPALPILRAGLTGIADEAVHIMVIVGTDGRVLWREGSTRVRRRADALGFVEGACWGETVVGTNAIGTALVARRPVQVYSAEHFVRSHHAWTCAAAPVSDPRSGRLLGVVDVSGPASTVHASTLALVDAVARLASGQLRERHLRDLESLRTIASPLLNRIEGRAMVTDRDGWLAASVGIAPPDRLMLPERLDGDTAWLPAFGACVVEPLPGGWLIRPVSDESDQPTRVVLDLSDAQRPTLDVLAASGSWQRALSPRHAELLTVLSAHPNGLSAAQLSRELLGDAGHTVTVRAELSRLRRHLGAVLSAKPYRFADWVSVQVIWPSDASRLLPHSQSPTVRRLRGGVDTSGIDTSRIDTSLIE